MVPPTTAPTSAPTPPNSLPSSPAAPAPLPNADAPALVAQAAARLKHVAPAPGEGEFVDVMAGAARWEIPVLDHGFVALVDVMPRLVPKGKTADAAIVQAARVSYGQGTKHVSEDRGLLRYLMRHRHSTPLEMVEFKFHVCMPIFVARQWIRHRTANVNEYSGRYSIIPDRFYKPSREQVRKQSKSNRQGGDERFGADEAEARTADEFVNFLDKVEQSYHEYLKLTDAGVSREMARIGLPVNMYTEWYWKCDLHNTLNFLSLRLDHHAQSEIRDFAAAMLALIEPVVPASVEAWRDYAFDSLRLSKLEIDALRDLVKGGSGSLAGENKRESAEWDAKRKVLGL